MVVEAGVRRGERPTTAERGTAIPGSPFLVSARWENNKASVRWPSEKKGGPKLNTSVWNARSVLDDGQPVKEKELDP